jgi:hypothetical protein
MHPSAWKAHSANFVLTRTAQAIAKGTYVYDPPALEEYDAIVA